MGLFKKKSSNFKTIKFYISDLEIGNIYKSLFKGEEIYRIEIILEKPLKKEDLELLERINLGIIDTEELDLDKLIDYIEKLKGE